MAIRVPRLKEPAMAALEVLKEVWAPVDYVDATKDFRVHRGQWLSMKGVSQIPHPISGNVETLKNVRFNTGFTLVDIIGGKRPASKAGTSAATAAPAIAPPAEYLLLGPAGNLVIRSEISDRAAFQRKMAAAAQAPAEGDGTNSIDQLNK